MEDDKKFTVGCMSETKNRRILITDCMFPNYFAAWRLNAIYEFIHHYDADILVLERIDTNLFPFAFNELKESYLLDEYDILFFNPWCNCFNIYNHNFDGTKFNGQLYGDYMLRKKKYRDVPLNINEYEFVYHIFLDVQIRFNQHYDYPNHKQIIHLYPGGGFFGDLPPIVGTGSALISTHIFTTENLKKVPNPIIECLGAPFVLKNQKPKVKDVNKGELRICHTSLGDPELKGGNIYVNIAEAYTHKYKSDDIVFYSIGHVPDSEYVEKIATMPQKDLDEFYNKEIDILISPETGKALNGWPLGVEGMVQGCILFTTDRTNLNERSGFNYGDEMVIIDIENISSVVEAIKTLYVDRELLHRRSIEIQKRTFQLFSYEKQMGKIFSFINSRIT